MGSQFMSLHLVDPAVIQARLRGDFADLVETLYRQEKPPDEALRPAFEVMARGTFVFLPKGESHPDGLMYCRAVEYLLTTLGRRQWSIEFYPDESEYTMWELAFGRCEASWLDLPHSEHGIGITAWKSPRTCGAFTGSIRGALQDQSFNPRYSPRASLEECLAALEEGYSTDYGLFVIFQG